MLLRQFCSRFIPALLNYQPALFCSRLPKEAQQRQQPRADRAGRSMPGSACPGRACPGPAAGPPQRSGPAAAPSLAAAFGLLAGAPPAPWPHRSRGMTVAAARRRHQTLPRSRILVGAGKVSPSVAPTDKPHGANRALPVPRGSQAGRTRSRPRAPLRRGNGPEHHPRRRAGSPGLRLPACLWADSPAHLFPDSLCGAARMLRVRRWRRSARCGELKWICFVLFLMTVVS